MPGTWTHLAEMNSVSVRTSSSQIWQEHVELGTKTDFLQGIGLQGYNPTQTWLVRLPPNTKATRTIKLSYFYTTKWYVCPLSKIKKAYLCKDKKIQTSQCNVEETIQTKPKNKQKTKKAKVPTQADNDNIIVMFMWISHTHFQDCKFSKDRNVLAATKVLVMLATFIIEGQSFNNELHRLCPAQQAED